MLAGGAVYIYSIESLTQGPVWSQSSKVVEPKSEIGDSDGLLCFGSQLSIHHDNIAVSSDKCIDPRPSTKSKSNSYSLAEYPNGN